MIDQVTVQRIIDTAQIVDVVSDYVNLKKRGVNYVGLCPFHSDTKPSFYVSPSKNICKCFACGEGGTAVHFLMKLEQLTYAEALKQLAKKYGIEVKERELSDREKQAANERESLLIANTFAHSHFQQSLLETNEGRNVGLAYFRDRGIGEDTCRKFQLGYSSEQRDAFTQVAIQKGFNVDHLEKLGLTIKGERGLLDRFRGRVIFPIHSLSGKVLGFGGRIMKRDEKLAKYVNSIESEIYHKSNELYGIYFAKTAISRQEKCFLVEGYTDVIGMHQAGIENVVSSSGTALTQGQIRLIHRFTRNVTLLFDGDAAGIKAALRGIDLLLEEGMNVKIVLLPEGEDPDSFSRSQSAEAFTQYIADHEEDFIRFKTRLLLKESNNDPIKRSEVINDLLGSIAIIPDPITQQIYLRECSQSMDIDEQILVKAIQKLKQAKLYRRYEPTPTEAPPPPPPPPASEEEYYPPLTLDDAPPEMEGEPTPPPPPPAVYTRMKKELEAEIIHQLIKHGGVPFYQLDDESWVTVGEYILEELEADEVSLQHATLSRMVTEYKAHCLPALIPDEANARSFPTNYFIYHQDPEISRIATHLISDKYQLSTIHSRFQHIVTDEEKLIDNIPRIIVSYKDYLLKEHLNTLQKELRRLQPGNSERENEIIKALYNINTIRKEYAHILGDRTILNRAT